MLNRICIAMAAVVFVAGSVRADFEGTVTALDKESVTVKNADGKETKFKLTKDTALEGPKGKLEMDKLKIGTTVTVKTAKDADDTAESIKLQGRGRAGLKQLQPRGGPNKKIQKQIQVNPANVKGRAAPAQPEDGSK